MQTNASKQLWYEVNCKEKERKINEIIFVIFIDTIQHVNTHNI